MRIFLFLVAFCLFVISCKNKSTETTNASVGNDYDVNGLNKNYDFTGTYELKDKDVLYTLKLHKRSVDGSYEMQFYDNSKNTDLYKSSIYDAKDNSANIYIKYLNNFQMDATSLGFKSGDTLFVLKNENDSIQSDFHIFKPILLTAKWKKISGNY